jgi:uncharacterized membrane protein
MSNPDPIKNNPDAIMDTFTTIANGFQKLPSWLSFLGLIATLVSFVLTLVLWLTGTFSFQIILVVPVLVIFLSMIVLFKLATGHKCR